MEERIELFDATIFPMTSLVEGKYSDKTPKCHTASGFFYTEQTPTEMKRKTERGEEQLFAIDNFWFVTNRHVVLPKCEETGNEVLLDSMVFCLRKTTPSGSVEWFPIVLSREDLIKKTKLHPDKIIDIAVIDITDNIININNAARKGDIEDNIILPVTLSNRDLPEAKKIPIEVASDIIVASYPKCFYDKVNKFPIVKSGIIASAWGAPFNGLPYFLIDAQLFPGSSGGLVLSKPFNYGVQNDSFVYSLSKQFALLGVYSGEPLFEETLSIGGIGQTSTINKSYGLGNVWYSYLIPEIINSGINYSVES